MRSCTLSGVITATAVGRVVAVVDNGGGTVVLDANSAPFVGWLVDCAVKVNFCGSARGASWR
jgi:hypothetical protein